MSTDTSAFITLSPDDIPARRPTMECSTESVALIDFMLISLSCPWSLVSSVRAVDVAIVAVASGRVTTGWVCGSEWIWGSLIFRAPATRVSLVHTSCILYRRLSYPSSQLVLLPTKRTTSQLRSSRVERPWPAARISPISMSDQPLPSSMTNFDLHGQRLLITQRLTTARVFYGQPGNMRQ